MLGRRVINRLRGAGNATTNIRDHFRRPAGTVVRAEFDDCEVRVGSSTTTLHLELADQGALHGLLQRIANFGLELIDVSVVTPPVDVPQETSEDRQAQFRRRTE